MTARREAVVASLLLLIALWLRLRGLVHMEFKWDEKQALQLGINLLTDRPWATGAPWPRTGMLSSNAIANAPLFNHIMALFWGLTHDPVGATRLVALCNWAALGPLYIWARRMIGSTRALLLLAFIAVSPFAVIYSRKLWAQDLLLPGLVLLLFGLERLKGPTFWRGLGLTLLGLLPVTQLHQSGPIFAVALGIAVLVSWALDRRKGKFEPIPSRPGLVDGALIVAALGLHAFYVIPYLEYLLTVPPEVFANRPKMPGMGTGYLRRLVFQAVPRDLLKFFEGDIPAFFAESGGWLRSLAFYGAIVTAIPLALRGLWSWIKTPRAIPYVGLGWILFVAMFVALRIRPAPHYVLILYPLPFLLLADGFKLPGPTEKHWVERGLKGLRWANVALLLVLTITYQNWLFTRGGARGDYGVVYSQRLAQADELKRRLEGGSGSPPGPEFRCRWVPLEVVFLLEWRMGRKVSVPPTQVCESWSGEYRWVMVVTPS